MPLSGNHLFIFLSELYSSNRDISVLRRIWQMDNSQGGSWGRSHLRIGVDVSWSDFSYQIILLFRVSFYIALLRSATEMGVFILMMLGLEWLMRFKQPDSNKTPSRWIFLTLSTILGFYGKLVSLLSFFVENLVFTNTEQWKVWMWKWVRFRKASWKVRSYFSLLPLSNWRNFSNKWHPNWRTFLNFFHGHFRLFFLNQPIGFDNSPYLISGNVAVVLSIVFRLSDQLSYRLVLHLFLFISHLQIQRSKYFIWIL